MGDATCSVRVVNRPIPSSKNRLRKRATVPSKMLMKATSPPTSFGASRSLFGPKVEGTFVSIRSRSVPALNEKCCWGDVRFPRALVDTQRGIDSNRPPPSITCLVASKPRTTHNKGPTQENKGNKKRWYISILSCFSCLFHHGSRSEKVTSVFQGPNMFAPFWCPPSEESDNVPIDAPDMASRSHCIPSHIGSDSESLITNYPGTSVRGTSRFAVVMDEDHDTPSALPFIDICSGSSTRVLESPPVCSLSHVSSHGCDPSHVLRNDVLQLCGGAASTSCSTKAHVMRPISVSSMIPSSHSMSIDVLRLQHSWAALEQAYSLHHVSAQIRTVGGSPRMQRVPNGTHSKQEENSTGPSLLHRDEAKIMQLVLSPVVTEPLQHPHSLEMSLTTQSPPAWLSPGTENSEELIPPFSERLSGMTALRHDTNPTRTERDMGLNPTVDSHLIAREVRIRMDPDEPSKTVPSTEIHAACMESRIPHQHSHNTTPTTVRHSFRTRPRTNTVGPNDDEMPLSPQSVDVTRETSVHTQKGTTCVHLDSSSIILIPQNFELSPQKGLKENVHYIVDVGSTPLDKHPSQQDDSTFLTSNRFTLAPCMKIDVDSIRRVPIFTHRIVSNHARKSDVYCSQKSALIRRPTAMRPTTQ